MLDYLSKHKQYVTRQLSSKEYIKMNRDVYSQMDLVEGLKKAARGNSRSKTAQLRAIFDEVEAAKDSGLSLKVIVAVLADRGLIFDLATFVNLRHRIKNERRLAGQKNTAHADSSKPKNLLLDEKGKKTKAEEFVDVTSSEDQDGVSQVQKILQQAPTRYPSRKPNKGNTK